LSSWQTSLVLSSLGGCRGSQANAIPDPVDGREELLVHAGFGEGRLIAALLEYDEA
jgi:hypothetical protein